MTQSERAPTRTPRISRTLFAGLLVVVAAIAAARDHESPAPSPTSAGSPTDPALDGQRAVLPPPGAPPGAHPARGEPRAPLAAGDEAGGARTPRERRGGLEPDGAMPAGATVLDDELPGVANLDPSLRAALRRAAADAADDGVELFVNSGWRSPEYQERLLREAVSKYGSEREAGRWVATPGTSAHVSGEAVDLGFAATAWLSEHGAEYGLCQIYRNELWHYELRPEAVDRGCPAMYADPTHDPRMQQ